MDDLSESKRDLEFIKRLREAIGGKSIRSFAEKCEISETALRQYLSGKSEPTRPPLNAIARTGGVNIKWLATGEGYKSDAVMDSIKEDLLAGIMTEIELNIVSLNRVVTAKEKARFIAIIYNVINKYYWSKACTDPTEYIKKEVDTVIQCQKVIDSCKKNNIDFGLLKKLVGWREYHDLFEIKI